MTIVPTLKNKAVIMLIERKNIIPIILNRHRLLSNLSLIRYCDFSCDMLIIMCIWISPFLLKQYHFFHKDGIKGISDIIKVI